MKQFVCALLVIGSLILSAAPLAADLFEPSPPCSAPSIPMFNPSDWEIQMFNRQVDEYKQCIEDFIDDQNMAVKKHQNAASSAIDEWNAFVKRMR